MTYSQTLDYYASRLHRIQQNMQKCIEHLSDLGIPTDDHGLALEALGQMADQIKAVAVMLRLEML